MRKLKVDIVNAEQTLKSYPFTKWSARIALVISIILSRYKNIQAD